MFEPEMHYIRFLFLLRLRRRHCVPVPTAVQSARALRYSMFEPEMHYIYFLFITASPPALCAGAYGGAKRKSSQVSNV